MTKQAIKWWKTFGFWNKIRMLIGSLGIGSEITLFVMESYPHWKIIAAIATGIGILISFLFTDNNSNNIVDVFEK